MKISKLFTLMAASAMMLTTACTSDEPVVTPTGSEASVTFTVDLPSSIATRSRTAYADGTTATRLTYAIYHKANDGSYEFVLSKSGLDVINREAQVTLNLLTGEEYAVAFWAAAKDAPYKINEKYGTMSVIYDNAEANDEKRDAFYACEKFKATANSTHTVTLTRPFAQLNIGTSDFEEARQSTNFVAAKSAVSVEGYDTLDLITGEATGECKTRDFAIAERPQGEEFPVESSKYDYLSMVYVLMPASDQIVSDVVLKVQDTKGSEQERDYTNIPLKRNYRTNIYGKLLTTENIFNVEISPAFKNLMDEKIVTADLPSSVLEKLGTEDSTVDFYDEKSDATTTYYYNLPSIAKGVTFNAHGASFNVKVETSTQSSAARKASKPNVISSENVTVKNAVIVLNDNAVYYNICANGFVAEDCVFLGSATLCAIVNQNISATFKNCKFENREHYLNGVYSLDDKTVGQTDFAIYAFEGAVVNVENCDFSADILYAIYSGGKCEMNAKGCTFRGWMSGWHNGGKFEDCTFTYGDKYYDCAICYGNTVFTRCKFEYVGIENKSTLTPLAGTRFGYNYLVSGRGPRLDFNECTYVSSNIPEYNGKPIDAALYQYGYGDDKTPANGVFIDGVKVFPVDNAEEAAKKAFKKAFTPAPIAAKILK